MQCVALPSKILQGIDRLSRNFLWGSSESKKKLHLIGWNKITKPKEEGGLGIQAAKPKNTTLLAKLNWRYHSENPPYGPEFLPKNTAIKEEYPEPKKTLSRAPQPGLRLKKRKDTFNKGSKWIARRDNGLSL